jgi:heme o synthase
LASTHQVYWRLLLETLAGISLVIASACVFNNYLDKEIDKKMSRTKHRAIAAGVVSGPAALAYGSMLGLFGFIILGFFTNWLVFWLGLLALVFYVIIYGFAKRRSVHGTLVGSLPGAAPPVAGYLAVTDHIGAGAVLLFLVLVFWQMPHFYAIAMYRYRDYKAAGLPILTVVKGMKTARRQIMLYILAFTLIMALLTVFGLTGYVYLAAAILLGCSWLYVGYSNYKLADELWGRRMFLVSLIVNLAWSLVTALGGRLP